MISDHTTAIANLTGAGRGLARPHSVTEPSGGGKFAPNGEVLNFPGNTVICHIPKTSAAYAQICTLQEGLKRAAFGKHFAFLPPESLHMTVFEGVCMSPLARGPFPTGTERTQSLANVSQVMEKRFADLALPSRFTIRPCGPFIHSGLGIAVRGSTAAEEQSLRHAREVLRTGLALYPPNFEAYNFHISLAYLLHWVSAEEAVAVLEHMTGAIAELVLACPEIDLGAPEFCVFENMFEFVPSRSFGA